MLHSPSAITIIAPCYNESTVAVKFLALLNDALTALPNNFQIVMVNDCSTDNTSALLHQFKFAATNLTLHIIDLPANVGHQAAILQGLKCAQSSGATQFIVMDSDGQDSPFTIKGLLEHGNADIIHVVRAYRRESLPFRGSYMVYRLLFRIFTGKQMNYGNFCLISRAVLDKAVAQSFTHFPAFLARQNVNKVYIEAPRENRLGGQSKMSFLKLLRHAGQSFSEYWGGFGLRKTTLP